MYLVVSRFAEQLIINWCEQSCLRKAFCQRFEGRTAAIMDWLLSGCACRQAGTGPFLVRSRGTGASTKTENFRKLPEEHNNVKAIFSYSFTLPLSLSLTLLLVVYGSDQAKKARKFISVIITFPFTEKPDLYPGER
jgi:hypothetical protein